MSRETMDVAEHARATMLAAEEESEELLEQLSRETMDVAEEENEAGNLGKEKEDEKSLIQFLTERSQDPMNVAEEEG